MTRNSDVDRLTELELFSGLRPEDVREVARLCTWTIYNPDVEILGENECTTDIFSLVRGDVVAKSYSASGREVTL